MHSRYPASKTCAVLSHDISKSHPRVHLVSHYTCQYAKAHGPRTRDSTTSTPCASWASLSAEKTTWVSFSSSPTCVARSDWHGDAMVCK